MQNFHSVEKFAIRPVVPQARFQFYNSLSFKFLSIKLLLVIHSLTPNQIQLFDLATANLEYFFEQNSASYRGEDFDSRLLFSWDQFFLSQSEPVLFSYSVLKDFFIVP